MLKLHKGEQYEPAFKQINPRSQVPVLIDGELVVTQVIAITLYLEAKFSHAYFLPSNLAERAKALEIFAWMNNTMHSTFMHIFLPRKFTDHEVSQKEIKNFAVSQYRSHLNELQKYVQDSHQLGKEWLTGDRISALDVYALTLMRWGTMAQISPSEFPLLWSFVQRVSEAPGVNRAIERERLQLDMSQKS